MKKINLIPGIMVLVVIFGGVQLLISQRLVLTGERFHRLSEESARLEKENREILEKISGYGCLRRIQLRAEEMGLEKTRTVVYLKAQSSIVWKP
jgi:hypothetical protein